MLLKLIKENIQWRTDISYLRAAHGALGLPISGLEGTVSTGQSHKNLIKYFHFNSDLILRFWNILSN